MNDGYVKTEPARAQVDALQGAAVVEFGAPWCGICAAAQPVIAQAMSRHPDVQHLKIHDGPGQPLGRSFGVKLWPTLVFLREGREVERLVRPTRAADISQALQRLDSQT
jgi:thioredoxin 1